MTDRAARLRVLAEEFVDAFNRHDADAVLDFFSDDAVFEDPRGLKHEGKAAIRAAFAPLFDGTLGQTKFIGEDLFVDADAGKVMTSWTLMLDVGGRPSRLRGLDLLNFEGDKLVRKRAYAKAETPLFEER